MCCWPFVQVELEDPPKSAPEEKKEYVLVSDQLRLHPGVSQLFFFSSRYPPTLPRLLPTVHLTFIYFTIVCSQIQSLAVSRGQAAIHSSQPHSMHC